MMEGFTRQKMEGKFYMKKRYRFYTGFMIALLLLICSCNRVDKNISEEMSREYIRTMPGVSVDKLTPDYWIAKNKDASDLIMNEEEIQMFNEKIMPENSQRRRFLAFTEPGHTSIDGKVLKEYLDESERIQNSHSKKGKEIGEKYWKKLMANVNSKAIRKMNPVLYAYAVNRGEIYQFPTDDIITDTDEFTFFNENQNTTCLCGEAVVILHKSLDKKWYFILTDNCAGWIKKENLAIVKNQETWEAERSPEHFLMVTEDEFRLEYDDKEKEISEKELTMGCKLTLIPWEEQKESQEGRQPYGNYLVKLPERAKDGRLVWTYAYIPYSRGVHVGYLDYTQENVLRLAFESLGDRYGWGGMYGARDCSQYIMEIYRCFGIMLPRNSTGLHAMLCDTLDVEGFSTEEKIQEIHKIPAGSILHMNGHVMIYLGQDDGQEYVISSVSSIIPKDIIPEDRILEEREEIIPVQSVLINNLSQKRKNGLSWMESIDCYKIIRYDK